jgi:hypothetical protein
MRERRAVVLGPDTAVLVERRLQSLVAEGWIPMGALGCAACAEGVVIVGVFERASEAGDQPASAATPLGTQAPPRRERTEPEGPPCPLCEGEMKRRVRKADGKPFWGCASFPECRGVTNWQDWSPPEARPPARPVPPPVQKALPGFAPAGEATACWGPVAEPPKDAEGPAWAGDPEDCIPF